MTENSVTITYKQDVEKVTFDLHKFDISLIPQLVKQLNSHLFIMVGRANFQDERYMFAVRAGRSPEGQMSLALKLKS
jgi:hypothetical protein